MGVVHELDEGLVSHLKGVIKEPEGPVMVMVLACRKVPDGDGEPEGSAGHGEEHSAADFGSD